MKKIIALLTFSVIISSCIEELEPIEPSFEKVYGTNLKSFPGGIAKLSDGTYMIYGNSGRTVIEGSISTIDRPINDREMPFIIQIDEFGNALTTRTYPIKELAYDVSLFPDPLPPGINPDGIYDVYEARFTGFIEMTDGNFMATFYATDYFWIHEGYMILDAKLDVIKFAIFNDSAEEFEKTYNLYRGSPRLYNSTDGETLVLFTECFYLDPDFFFPLYATGFYSIVTMDSDGIKEIMDIESASESLSATDMTFDDAGNSVVAGVDFFNSSRQFIHTVDNSNGSLMSSSSISSNAILWNKPLLIKNGNGYLLGEIATQDSLYNVSLKFINDGFETTNTLFIPPKDEEECYIRSLIALSSGGYAALSFTCRGLATVHKFNQEGGEVWRWDVETDNNDGALDGRIIETVDGGIIYVGGKDFNSSGHKISVIKIDKNGKSVF